MAKEQQIHHGMLAFAQADPPELKLGSNSTAPITCKHGTLLRRSLEEVISHQKALIRTSNRQQQWRDMAIPLEMGDLICSWNIFHTVLSEDSDIYGILKTEITICLQYVDLGLRGI